MAMSELRAAVVGAGRLGGLHASKYAAHPEVKFQFVTDIDRARAEQLASQYGARVLDDYRALGGKVDIVTIATPAVTHHEIASHLLAAGCDLLVEKPLATTIEQARELASIAERNKRVLQVGHLERFNPAVIHLKSLVKGARFVECDRLAPFTERGTDVDVILDLMVHDIDVILSLMPADAVSVEALGVAVLTDSVDVANARIRFSSGLVANLNTSRVAPRRERKIRFFQPDAYISVDYETRRIQVYRKEPAPAGSSFPSISANQIDFSESDALANEVASFIAAVKARSTPEVSARDGVRAIELIERIRNSMERL
jgi:predicted dehydrogenase